MNRIITRSFLSLVLLAMGTLMVPLTAQTEEQIARFKQERETYFTEKLQLTQQESEAFWPVYNDFHNRKMKLVQDERNTFRYCHKNADNLSDDEFVETLEKIRKLKDEQHQMEQEYYHEEFPKVLPPKKVMMLYKVEWDFRNHLIREIRGHGEGSRGKRGDRPGGGPGSGPGGGPGGGPDQEMAPPPVIN